MYLSRSRYVGGGSTHVWSEGAAPDPGPGADLVQDDGEAVHVGDSTLYTVHCTPVHLYLYTSALVVTTSAAAAAGDTSSGRQGAV